MIRVANRVGLGQLEVVGNILLLEVTPRLRRRDLRPRVVETVIQRLVGRNPVIGTSTETLALVRRLFSTLVVKVVWQKPIRLVSDTSQISKVLG